MRVCAIGDRGSNGTPTGALRERATTVQNLRAPAPIVVAKPRPSEEQKLDRAVKHKEPPKTSSLGARTRTKTTLLRPHPSQRAAQIDTVPGGCYFMRPLWGPEPSLHRVRSSCSTSEVSCETHVPTASQEPQAHPRVPQAHEDPCWPRDPSSPPPQGAPAVDRLGLEEVAPSVFTRRGRGGSFWVPPSLPSTQAA